MGRQKHKRWRRYLLTTGLSLICMVLSSWLFVLGRLKLLFFLWRREQHEPSPWGEEDREDAREPDLFINEISKQFDWNVCSSTNSWFCGGGEREREKEDMLLMNHRISSGFTGLSKQQAKIFDGVEKKHRLKHNSQQICLIVGKCFITTSEIYGASCLYQVPSVKIFRSVIPMTDEQNLKVTIHVCRGPASRGRSDATLFWYIPWVVHPFTCDLFCITPIHV